jgi:ABC-type amino acid transport system permease subunit
LVLGALGPRLVHHLHNTGFAALFPVTELFGGVVEMANETFEVSQAAAFGALIYIAMSQGIWLLTRALETRLRPPGPARTGHVVEVRIPA